jgi:hypothetical protein
MDKKVKVDEQPRVEAESFRLVIDRETFSKTKEEKELLKKAKTLWKKANKQAQV